jgi:hypothetical protein
MVFFADVETSTGPQVEILVHRGCLRTHCCDLDHVPHHADTIRVKSTNLHDKLSLYYR